MESLVFKHACAVTLKASSGNWKEVILRILCDCWVHLRFLVPRRTRGTEELMTGESCQIKRRGQGGGEAGLCARCGEGSFWKSSGTVQVSFAKSVLARVAVLTQPHQVFPLLCGLSSPLTSVPWQGLLSIFPPSFPSDSPLAFLFFPFPATCSVLSPSLANTPPPKSDVNQSNCIQNGGAAEALGDTGAGGESPLLGWEGQLFPPPHLQGGVTVPPSQAVLATQRQKTQVGNIPQGAFQMNPKDCE